MAVKNIGKDVSRQLSLEGAVCKKFDQKSPRKHYEAGVAKQ